MGRARLFAEDYFQAAFDRGRDHATRLLNTLRAEGANLPRDCPLSRSAPDVMAYDVLRSVHATEHVHHLVRALAVIGAKLEWRKLTERTARTSTIVLRSQSRARRRNSNTN